MVLVLPALSFVLNSLAFHLLVVFLALLWVVVAISLSRGVLLLGMFLSLFVVVLFSSPRLRGVAFLWWSSLEWCFRSPVVT